MKKKVLLSKTTEHNFHRVHAPCGVVYILFQSVVVYILLQKYLGSRCLNRFCAYSYCIFTTVSMLSYRNACDTVSSDCVLLCCGFKKTPI